MILQYFRYRYNARMQDWISTNEAASILGCTYGRVRQLLIAGTLNGQKLNERAWIIARESVESLAKKPKSVGRPRVAATEKKTAKPR